MPGPEPSQTYKSPYRSLREAILNALLGLLDATPENPSLPTLGRPRSLLAGQFHTKPSIAGHQETNGEIGDRSQSPRDCTVVPGHRLLTHLAA